MSAGASTGTTRNVETTARWSDGQGKTAMSVTGPPISPTTWDASVSLRPAVKT